MSENTTLTPEQLAIVGEWFARHHGYPCAATTLADLQRMLSARLGGERS